MEGLVVIVVVLTLGVQAWSLTIKSGEERNDAMSRDVENKVKSLYDLGEVETSFKMLLDNVKRLQEDHPFGFGIRHTSGSRGLKRDDYSPMMSTHAFHGRRNINDDAHEGTFTDDQNTSVFHGKRNGDLATSTEGMIASTAIDDSDNNNKDDFPSRTSAFHGKRNMEEFIRLLLNHFDRQRMKKNLMSKQ